MSRKCENFIDSFMDYTSSMESPDSFFTWGAISLISSALRRQVWVDMGHFEIYPNMYIVLVSDPGVCRKGSAMGAAIKLTTDISDIKFSADATTREALIRALKQSESMIEIEKGIPYVQSALTIVSKELSVFLGTGNHDLLSLLTDLYDNPDIWEYRTKNSGIDTINNVWLSIFAASTPEWLSGSIPITAIGGGFTSRILFIVEKRNRKKVAFPILTEKQIQLKADLKHDLELITTIKGPITINKNAKEYFSEWYRSHSFETMDDKRFWGYAERKHIHILKLSAILSMAENAEREISELNIRQAHYMIDSLEEGMISAFGGAGRSDESVDIDMVLELIKTHGTLSKQKLLEYVWRDVSPKIFEIVISLLLDRRVIDRIIEGGETVYKYVAK